MKYTVKTAEMLMKFLIKNSGLSSLIISVMLHYL